MNDVIAKKLADIESAKAKIEAAKAEIESIEKSMGELLEAEGWNYHDNIENHGYGECWGWAAWLHPSIILDEVVDAPNDESLMLLYKYPSSSMQICG